MIKIVDNIILLGTSHVAHQSKSEIEETIVKYLPEVVGIELDYNRFQSLMSENKDKKKGNYTKKIIKEIGFSGYMFALIAGYVQQKVGESMDIEPGIDMKTAYLVARENKIPTALIDLDIRLTLKKLSNLSFRKKISMFSSLFFKSFKKEYRQKLEFDVKKGVPDEKVIVEMLKIVKKEVPDLYNILIHDRNIFMCNKLLELKQIHKGYILAVVGAGHLEGMKEILEDKLKVTPNISFSFKVELEENSLI